MCPALSKLPVYNPPTKHSSLNELIAQRGHKQLRILALVEEAIESGGRSSGVSVRVFRRLPSRLEHLGYRLLAIICTATMFSYTPAVCFHDRARCDFTVSFLDSCRLGRAA